MTKADRRRRAREDPDKRADDVRQEMQRIHQQISPFVIMFQEIEQVRAARKNVEGFSPAARQLQDSSFYATSTK